MLLRKPEKLERTNKTLDKMQDDLNETDRNINGMKSIWGTMSNWFEKPLKRSTPAPSSNAEESNDRKDTDDNNVAGRSQGERRAQNVQRYDEPQTVDDIVDKNLDQILAGLSMLKDQGLAFGNEIESQNRIIDDIFSILFV